MNYLELKSPEQLTAVLNSLNISPKRKKNLTANWPIERVSFLGGKSARKEILIIILTKQGVDVSRQSLTVKRHAIRKIIKICYLAWVAL